MADQKHLDIIKQGGEAWGRFMDEIYETEVRADLSGADLSGINFQNAQFLQVNFSGANLSGGKFYGTNFSGSNLRNADLRNADLSHTDLSWANFEGADLSGEKTNLWKVVCNGTNFVGANLSKANLRDSFISQGANLTGEDTNLSEADLSGAYLCGTNFSRANLRQANLQNVNLSDDFGSVDLSGANLSEADLYQANLCGANLIGANLYKSFLSEVNFRKANLTGADLRESDLDGAIFIETILDQAKLSGSHIYGASVWKASLVDTAQDNLIITAEGESIITVDDLEVAQFIYLMLNNQKIRAVLDSITSKAVLILGSFTEERKAVLDAIREELRNQHYVPILFDFDRPAGKDVTGTVETLARMARFIIADLTNPSSIPHELATIVPLLRTTPVLPIKLAGTGGYTLFTDYQEAYAWVLDTHEYNDSQSLISALPDVIAPADKMADKFRRRASLDKNL